MLKIPGDPMHRPIVLDTNFGGESAIRCACENATPLVVWEDGRIQNMSAERLKEVSHHVMPILTTED